MAWMVTASASPLVGGRCVEPLGVVAVQRYGRLAAADATDGYLLTAGDAGVAVWERSPQRLPRRVGFWLSPAPATGIAIAPQGWAAVALGPGGLVLLDLLDVLHPDPITWPPTGDRAWSVAVDGDLLYVGADSALEVWDLSVVDRPRMTRRIVMDGPVTDLAVHGGALYAVGGDQLTILDVTQPTSPHVASTMELPGASRIAVDGDRMVVSGVVVTAFDLTSPDAPVALGSWLSSEALVEAAVAGSYAYSPTTRQDPAPGIEVWLLPTDAAPEPVALIAMDGPPTALWQADGTLFVRDADDRLQAFDLSDPAAPALVEAGPPPGLMTSVAGAGRLAVVGHIGMGIDVLDVANPTQPHLLSRTELAVDAVAVSFAGRQAYAVTLAGELTAIDLEQPTSPVASATVQLPARPTSLAVDGGLAVVGLGEDGLVVVELGDPLSPHVVAHAPDLTAVSVELHGRLAFLVDIAGALRTVTLAQPSAPRELWRDAYLNTTGFTYRAGYLIASQVLYNDSGLRIYTVGADGVPVFLAGVAGVDGSHVVVAGSRVVSIDDDHVHLLDISDPSQPVLLGSEPVVRGTTAAIAVDSDDLLAIGGGLVQSFRLDCARSAAAKLSGLS